MLPSGFTQEKTKRFSCISLIGSTGSANGSYSFFGHKLELDLNCAYTLEVVSNIILSGNSAKVESAPSKPLMVQIADFENIDWDPVMAGSSNASSYLVRKGLSRKAQLSIQIRRYLSKHPDSVLKAAVPFTVVVETWSAFEEMKMDFGGLGVVFDSVEIANAPLRQKLDWVLGDARMYVEEDPACAGWRWILKPSVTNKGADISLHSDWESVLDALEACPDTREWVLQRYVENPLLIDLDGGKRSAEQTQKGKNVGHKFHLRVYVLCVGALKVFVSDEVLILVAAHKYATEAWGHDIHAHLTNTARAAETHNFDESRFVKLLDHLPAYITGHDATNASRFQAGQTEAAGATINDSLAMRIVDGILADIHGITKDLFAAFENEYSTFCPMSNCFELFGLDFIVDDRFNTSLLEVNPGPDFKQTGTLLQGIISRLWEQTMHVALDTGLCEPKLQGKDSSNDALSSKQKQRTERETYDPNRPLSSSFTQVYAKDWSISKMQGGMSFMK